MSNRLTFSLASLIFLIAFGLVFGTTDVLAHNADNIGLLRSHSHATPYLSAQDMNGDGDTTDKGEAEVQAHNAHPQAVVSLAPGQDNVDYTNKTIVVTTGANTFKVQVDFGVVVSNANDDETADATLTLDTAPTVLILNAAKDGFIANGASITTAFARKTSSNQILEATVTIAAAALPTGVTDDTATGYATRETFFRITPVAANDVYSLQVDGVINEAGTGVEDDVPGSGNYASAGPYLDFRLIKERPTAPGAPTGLTATSNHERGTITLNWVAPTDTGTSAITKYEVTKTYGTPVMTKKIDAGTATTITIPEASDPALATDTEFTFTVTATNAVGTSPASNSVTAEIDRTAPTVTIAAPTSAKTDGSLDFTITTTEMFGTGANDLEVHDFTVTGHSGTPTLTDPTGSAPNIKYMLNVMPAEGKSVTVTLDGDVRDANGNKVDVTTTPITATYDRMAPTLESYSFTVVSPTQLTVKLVFNEDVAINTIDIDDARGSGVAQAGSAKAVSGEDHTYTILINAPNHATSAATYMSLEEGLSDTSTPANSTTADIELTYTRPTPPAKPADLAATPGVGSVTLKWTVVSGAAYEYSKDGGTTWMDAGAGSQVVSNLTGGTAVTFSVRVKAVGTTPAGEVATVTATPTSPGTAALTIAAGSYKVLVGSDFDADTLPNVATTEIAGFPDDLAAFLIAGGTIDVVATGGDVIISEFMVARDSNKIGSGDPTDGQWIELRNQHATEAATGITVSFSSAKPAPAVPTGLQDRLSNVVGQGWAFPGALGNDVLNGSSNDKSPVNFISIRRKEPGKDGWTAGHWEKTPTSLVFAPGRVGTPNKVNKPTEFKPVENRTPSRAEVTINEVANRMDNGTEWIELKGPANKSLKNWKLSIATAVGTETTIFTFPNNDNIKISDNGYLLLTDVDPLNNELAPDFTNGVPDPKRYKNAIVTLGALPNDGNFVLILRSNKDKTNHEAIEDIAGYAGDALKRASPYTTLWPLTGNVGVISSHNKLVGGKVYARVRANINGYSATAGNKLNESAFGAVGFTGLGYDRNANAKDPENGGTPGHPNDNFKGDGAEAKGDVIISEIMFATRNGGPARARNLPQWIEIHNMSDFNSVNLANWRLEIVNSGKNADGSQYAGKFSEHVALSGTIPPNQTYLIVSHIAGHNTRLPTERVKVVGKKLNETLLNSKGFHLTLKAKVHKAAGEHVTVDTVGNLNAPAAGDRRADARSFAGNAWELSDLGASIAEDSSRISISRRTRAHSAPNTLAKGTDMAGWILTDVDPRYAGLIQLTYYGRLDDRATPGYTIGGALPVSLSKFRADRLATGEIVVRWITESELNNAGFNILRSDTRDGQFTKLNKQMIAGQGTTSERTLYEFVDKTAKPNVVYYYQIQDVSLDGDVATLRTSRLKGHISPAGKATTTWGELKSLQ